MIFLHGGGDTPDYRVDIFGRFVRRATVNGACSLALVVAEDTEARAHESVAAYTEIFASLPHAPAHIHPVFVSVTQPLQRAHLASIHPSGVFVCGGVTPLYHQALCVDTSWLAYLVEAHIPYCGTSAGAAIAAQRAIIGGWQATRNANTRAVVFNGASEGLDHITVQDGLGLVPFAIDVHASQMGTVTRLIHAVELGLVAEGWALDENTVLQWDQDEISIYGEGHAYRVWCDATHPVQITVHIADSRL